MNTLNGCGDLKRSNRVKKLVSMQFVLTLFVIVTMVLTLLISIAAEYRVSRQSLSESTLENNRIYAAKLAGMTDLLFRSMQQSLYITSQQAAYHLENKQELQAALDDLFTGNRVFNSVMYSDENGKIVASSPRDIGVAGKTSNSFGFTRSLQERKFLVTQPYQTITGRLIVFVSTPVYDRFKHYKGFIGGTIYLQEKNSLSSVLAEPIHKDGSYVFVVDQYGNIIYHPDKTRIGEVVNQNPAVADLIQGRSGAKRLNSSGVDMLAGYAPVQANGWGVVMQTPAQNALDPSLTISKETIVTIIPFFLILLILTWWTAKRIAMPLRLLAGYASLISKGQVDAKLPEFQTRFYEMNELQKAMLLAVRFLRNRMEHLVTEAATDPLTGLANRRTFDMTLEAWLREQLPFALILLDLDYFKHVNDAYGHLKGDQLLRHTAELMQGEARKGDLCCRFGGEEFAILLPYVDAEEARFVAERIRIRMETDQDVLGEPITASIGISDYPSAGNDSASLLAKADEALYEAKRNGRNQTVIAKTNKM